MKRKDLYSALTLVGFMAVVGATFYLASAPGCKADTKPTAPAVCPATGRPCECGCADGQPCTCQVAKADPKPKLIDATAAVAKPATIIVSGADNLYVYFDNDGYYPGGDRVFTTPPISKPSYYQFRASAYDRIVSAGVNLEPGRTTRVVVNFGARTVTQSVSDTVTAVIYQPAPRFTPFGGFFTGGCPGGCCGGRCGSR